VGIIVRYVRWAGHDAGGTLPPVEVVAGVLAPGAWRQPDGWPPLDASEVLVYVPPQWLGDWDDGGRRLAPGYQHVWRVHVSRLTPLPVEPLPPPYRPPTLPTTATGPRPLRAGRPGAGSPRR
jgi:hypothetical protein